MPAAAEGGPTLPESCRFQHLTQEKQKLPKTSRHGSVAKHVTAQITMISLRARNKSTGKLTQLCFRTPHPSKRVAANMAERLKAKSDRKGAVPRF
jgi:hypothetical protein